MTPRFRAYQERVTMLRVSMPSRSQMRTASGFTCRRRTANFLRCPTAAALAGASARLRRASDRAVAPTSRSRGVARRRDGLRGEMSERSPRFARDLHGLLEGTRASLRHLSRNKAWAILAEDPELRRQRPDATSRSSRTGTRRTMRLS